MQPLQPKIAILVPVLLAAMLAVSACNSGSDSSEATQSEQTENSAGSGNENSSEDDSTSTAGADGDGDGTNDSSDNCPDTANPDQNDSDNDARGNACEDDSSSGNDGSSGDDPLAVGGNKVMGPADPIQENLQDAGDTLGDTQVIGDTSQELVNALVAIFDGPDALATSFQDFAMNQNPDELVMGGKKTGEALLRFQAGVSETLRQLSQEGNALPNSERLTTLLDDLATQARNGQTGTTEGGDLSSITNLLTDISGELETASENVPEGVQNAPVVSDLFAALGSGAGSLGAILESTGKLDGEAFSAELTNAFDGIVGQLSDSLPEQAPDQFDQIEQGATTASAVFEEGLALLLEPIFQSLRGVLAPVTGDEAPLSPVLDSLLAQAGDGIAGLPSPGGDLPAFFENLPETLEVQLSVTVSADNPADAFAQLISGGLPLPEGGETPQLANLLSGVPLLGDLVSNATEGQLPGGIQGLQQVLMNNGTDSLASIIQGIPGLESLSGGGAPSLPVVNDLVTALMSFDPSAGDGGIPLIGQVLDTAGENNKLGEVLNNTLTQLANLSGGLNDTQGFLPIDQLGPLGGVVDGLLGENGPLGGLLGGLLGSIGQ